MSRDHQYDRNPSYRRPDPSRRSIILLFTIGSFLLIIPLSVVLIETPMCRASSAACNTSETYKLAVSAFPYVMIGGGMLIGYNMKRISDSMRYDERDGDASDEDGGDTALSL